MISITAVIRSRVGEEEAMKRALLDVARHVHEAGPDTRAFFVSQDAGDARTFGLGKLYRRMGKREQASEHLTIATTMYREMGMTYWLEQAQGHSASST